MPSRHIHHLSLLAIAALWSCGQQQGAHGRSSEKDAADKRNDPAAKAPAADVAGFPWDSLQRCGLVDVVKTPEGQAFYRNNATSQPFTLSAKGAILTHQLTAKATLETEFFLDKIVSKARATFIDPTAAAKATLDELGAQDGTLSFEDTGYLPAREQYDQVVAKLGMADVQCSILPLLRRTQSAGGVLVEQTFDPALPSILNANVNLDDLKAEIGARRTFPPVKVTATSTPQVGQVTTKTSMVTVTFAASIPDVAELAALGLSGDPTAHFALRQSSSVAGGEEATAQVVYVFDVATKQRRGVVFRLNRPPFLGEALIAFPADEASGASP